MKQKPILLTVLALTLPLAGTQAQQWTTNTLPSGLIAWWQAEGNLLDSAGPHHGTGSTAPTYAPGRFGQAFHFNGVDQSVSIPDGYADLDGWTQFTLEAWFNADNVADAPTPGAGRAIFSKVGNPSDHSNYNQGYQLGWYANGSRLVMQFNPAGMGWPGLATTAVLPAPLLTNTWYHIVSTYDHNEVRIYLNGMLLVTNVIGPVTLQNSSSSLRLSKDDNLNVPFAGRIDDARIYTRALTAAEVTYLYAAKPLDGAASWWPADNNATDVLGGRNGALEGTATFAPGVMGQAFELSADGAAVTIPHDPALNVPATGFTVHFWMQGVKNQSQSLYLVVDKSHGWVDSTGWLFQGYSSSGQIFFGIGAGGSAIDNFPLATSTTDVLDGQWHHVAGTWDGALLRIFVDGVAQDQAALTAPVNNTRPVNVGYSWGGNMGAATRFFRGKVDELALYHRALTTNEIAAIYAANAGRANPPTLVVELSGGSVQLSWPASAAGFTLAASTNLGPSAVWTPVATIPFVVNGRYTLTSPIVGQSRFFRLQAQ